MPNCQNCGHKWSLGDTVKVAFKLNGNSGRECSNCGEIQYVSKKSRSRTGVMGITAVLLVVFIRPLLNQNIGTSLLLAIPVVLVLIIANLYMTELSSERETVR